MRKIEKSNSRQNPQAQIDIRSSSEKKNTRRNIMVTTNISSLLLSYLKNTFVDLVTYNWLIPLTF